jgi:WD40 repeat protein
VSYDAFLSYSHAADDALAPAVQRALQTLARPWNRRRALEVFRDQTGLAVSPGLWTSICAGLDESEHFVLLASPEAATSTWVNQEIERWLASHSIDRLLPVLTAGEWMWNPRTGDFDWDRSTAVPAALRGAFTEEPRHLDLRWARTEAELDLRHSRFRDAMAELAAPMHHMSPQDLESSDVARFRHLVRLRRAVVGVLCALLALVSAVGVLALHNAQQARQEQTRVELQAKRALSLQLLAQAKVVRPQHLTLSLLLTAEAARLNPTEAWGSLVSGLQDTPGLAKVYDVPGGAQADPAPAALNPAADVYASVTHLKANRPVVQLWTLSTGRSEGKLVDDNLYGLSATELVSGPRGELAARYLCLKRLCANAAGGIQLWDMNRHEGHLLPASAGFSALTFSHSGARLAAADAAGRVRVWDVSSRRLLVTMRSESRGRPTGLAFTADDRTLALAQRRSGRIVSWVVGRSKASGRATIVLPKGEFPEQMAFAAGHLLAALDTGGEVRLWNAVNGAPKGRLGRSGAPVVSLASEPGGTLATAAADGTLRVWHAARHEQLASVVPSGAPGPGVTVMFDERGDLVSAGSDIRIWDVARWGDVGSVLYHHPAAVTALAVSRDGVVASGDARGVIRTWDLADGKPERRWALAHHAAVTALAFSSEGVLASGDQDGAVRLWRVSTGDELGEPFDGHDGEVTSVAFGSDGATVAAGYGKGTHRAWHRLEPIHVWDVATGSVSERLPIGLKGDVASVAFGPSGLFASAGADFLAVWPVHNWQSSQDLVQDPRGGPYTAVAFNADGNTLASSGVRFGRGVSGTVVLWSMPPRRGQLGAPLTSGTTEGNGVPFQALRFSPDGNLLAGVGSSGTQLWDVKRRQPLGGLLGVASADALAISPDNRVVIVGDSTGVVQTLPATVDGWLRGVCNVVGRNLSQSEWDSFVGSASPYEATCPQYPGG